MTAIADVPNPTATDPESPAPAENDDRGSRRKKLLLLLLLLVFALLTLLSAWYLIFRKPLSELPLPGVTTDATVPAYSFTFYGPQSPAGIALSPDGSRVYVAQTGGTRTVMIFDSKGNLIKEVAPPDSQGGARIPTYIAVNPVNGDVYVSDRFQGAVAVFDGDGNFKKWFTPDSSLKTWAPLGLAFDSKGNVYIGDVAQDDPQHGNAVLEFDSTTGKLLQTFGVGAGMSYPNGIAVDGQGHVAVADGSNGRLLVFDASAKIVSTVARGAGDGQLGMPRGVAFDDHGQIAVVDTSAQQVFFYKVDSATGTLAYAGSVGAPGRGDGMFAFPVGVGADTHGRVYVADAQNNRVQVWNY